MWILKYSEKVRERFPGLKALTNRIEGVNIENGSEELEEFRNEVISQVRERKDLDELKDVSIFRKYRDFFWDLGIDPTKTRPASEALIRRILQGKEIPSINTLVDAYNLASIKSEIPLAAFDYDTLEGDLELRFSERDEVFRGIGMDEPKELTGDEIVVSDSEKIVAIYPYRDSEETKITTDTTDVLLMVCGIPGVGGKLDKAREIMLDYVTEFCDGEVV